MKEEMIMEELVILEVLAELMESLLRKEVLCIRRSRKQSRGVSCQTPKKETRGI
jgi:hypothetical protein